jgi:hypothetical protein
MTDVLIYWRDYRKNAEAPMKAWHSNAQMLRDVQPGDRLWFVTSGKNLGHDAVQAGFLVAVWQVQEVRDNPGDDPSYPKTDYRIRIVPNEGESVTFDDPVPVDHLIRPEGRDKATAIGRFLQGPRKLKDQTIRLLRATAGPKMALKWLTGSKT